MSDDAIKTREADETIVTRIHRETRESLDSTDDLLSEIASKATDLRRVLRSRKSDSARKLEAALAASAAVTSAPRPAAPKR